MKLSDAERSCIRQKFSIRSKSLVVYFGFIYPARGVEWLFEIADPKQHYLILISDINPGDSYHQLILERIRSERWTGNVTVTGHLPNEDVARILATADAAVFPFRDGGGIWNSSVHAVVTQGTFLVMTSLGRHGYDPAENIYYARPGDNEDMRRALNLYAGRKNTCPSGSEGSNWESVAEAHGSLYRVLSTSSLG
jgi:hypothetical protein